LHTALPEPSTIDSAVGVPPVTCHAKVELSPEVMVVGVALKVSMNGTVTVTVCGLEVPAGPVAVREKVVVVATGVETEPETGRVPESSVREMEGVTETEVAFVVVQVSVVDWPALTEVGLAVNSVICGGAGGATVTFAVCGELVPPGPVATAVYVVV
jgi:hypothetical protein